MDSFKRSVSKELGIPLEYAPASFKQIGKVAILRPWSLSRNLEEKCANYIIRHFKHIEGVLIMERSYGHARKPSVLSEYGKVGETTHKELGAKFFLDPRKVMFSPGNLNERTRMISVCNEGERLLDMFACIGNLSLIPTLHKRIETIGIEKNKETYYYLQETVKKNKLKGEYKIANADCRSLDPGGREVDRILMGYFNVTQEHIEAALTWIKKEAIIHLSQLVIRGVKHKVPFKTTITDAGFKIKSATTRKVKSFSPTKIHITHDIQVKRND